MTLTKYILALILIFIFSLGYACDCDEQPMIIDLYSADVIFRGRAISKVYSSDSSQYTITFEASRFFKNVRSEQQYLAFTKKAEAEFTGIISSCDFHLEAGNEWLIVANYINGGITFSYCSRSRVIDKNPITKEEHHLLENLSRFDLTKVRIFTNSEFHENEPLIDLDSLSETVGDIIFQEQSALVIFDIEPSGIVTAANFHYKTQKPKLVESDFLISWYENIEYRKPQNKFEETVLFLSRQIKRWSPQVFKATGEATLGRNKLWFTVDNQGRLRITR